MFLYYQKKDTKPIKYRTHDPKRIVLSIVLTGFGACFHIFSCIFRIEIAIWRDILTRLSPILGGIHTHGETIKTWTWPLVYLDVGHLAAPQIGLLILVDHHFHESMAVNRDITWYHLCFDTFWLWKYMLETNTCWDSCGRKKTAKPQVWSDIYIYSIH